MHMMSLSHGSPLSKTRGNGNRHESREESDMGAVVPGFTSTGAILVLFILLVIISRSLFV